MSSTPPLGGIVFVEALESRIAPTGLTAISGDPTDPNATGDSHYVTFTTAPAPGKLGFVPASVYGINTPHVFALKLTGNGTFDPDTGVSTGDELVVFNAVTGFNRNAPLIQANKGTVVAFFLDRNALPGGNPALANQVFADELVGVSLAKKDVLTINGNVHGSIVTNLLNGGTTVSLTSVGRPSQGINGLTMNGNVFGDILAGGNIKNVLLVGSVNNVLAGTAANNRPFDFSDGTAAPTGTITGLATVAAHHGSNINNVTINTLTANGRIQAGDGGFTATGGAVTNIVLQSDADAFSILSGAGGDGTVGILGGTGGIISNVRVVGAAGTVVNTPITVQAGHGGNNGVGHGGTGGLVTGLAVGFDSFDTTTDTGSVSADLLGQNVIVHGGDGGSGIKGGNGGVVSDSQVVGLIPNDNVVGSNGANAEIQVFGGAGGVPTTAGKGKGGRGGNVAQVVTENVDTSAAGQGSSILVQGGLGGAAARGGNISNVDLLGTVLTVNGGAGGNGTNKGGNGGSLNAVGIESLSNLFTHQLTLNGGTGGDGFNGPGGAGGNVFNVTMPDADLTVLSINTGTHANGGHGQNGVGGAGGSVGADPNAPVGAGGVNLFNSAPSGQLATASVRTGQGGDGTRGGGAGGNIDTFQLLGVDFSFSVAASNGGTVFNGAGRGGAGGSLTNVGITNAPITPTTLADPTGLSGAVSSGAGGGGLGKGGNGGKGGDLTGVSLGIVFNASVTAGAAGNGPSGAGAGGSINGAAATSLQGAITVTAGAGGAASGSASNGGSINAFVAAAQTNISLVAGNGGSGGSGGSITNSGTTTDQLTGVPNVGNLTVTAGNGTSSNGVAGVGGSITVFNGFVADGGTTAITAGAGGGGTASTASGHGGNIDSIKLTGTSDASEAINGLTSQVITLDGGAAGVAGNAARGRTGGSVSNVVIYNLDAGTVVQHVAAGDGAAGLRKGGAGGNVSEIHVGLPTDATADIGIRSGVAYGYALGGAGGIFAGVGGGGSRHSGPNGNVTNVTAHAIASIVAGKGAVQLCSKVSGIDLEGLTRTVTNTTDPTLAGAFVNFDTANLVGSVQNPGVAGASSFKQGDGLIATADPASLQTNNFPAEAVLTVDPAGNRVLVDFQEPNQTPQTTAAPAFLG